MTLSIPRMTSIWGREDTMKALHVQAHHAAKPVPSERGLPRRPSAAGQTSLAASNHGLQTKLRVGAVNDPLEHEADRVADAVVSGAPLPAVGAASAGVQAKCAECEAEGETIQREAIEEQDETIQTKAEAGGPAKAGAEQAAAAVASGGTPLSADARAYFEPRFGRDLSDVRVHASGTATQAARGINALAYTLGRNVAFASGEYAPGTHAGRHLIAHELAHVVQQSGTIAPVLRRQTAQNTRPRPRMNRVRDLARAADPTSNKELRRMLVSNQLDGTASRVMGPFKLLGSMHDWRISVALDAGLGASGQTRGKTGDPIITSEQRRIAPGARPTPVTVHTIPITINPTLASSAEERTAFPNEQERMDQMAASALLHELIHARLKMGIAPGDFGWFEVSPIIADFTKVQGNVAKANTEQAQVRTETLKLVLIAEKVVGSTILDKSKRAGFLQETIDHLVEEKFAKQTAGRAFGLSASISNKEVADAYGDQVERTIRGMAPSINTLGNNASFSSQI